MNLLKGISDYQLKQFKFIAYTYQSGYVSHDKPDPIF